MPSSRHLWRHSVSEAAAEIPPLLPEGHMRWKTTVMRFHTNLAPEDSMVDFACGVEGRSYV